MLVLIFLCNFCVASNGAKAERTALIFIVAAAVLFVVFVCGYFWFKSENKPTLKPENVAFNPKLQQEEVVEQANANKSKANVAAEDALAEQKQALFNQKLEEIKNFRINDNKNDKNYGYGPSFFNLDDEKKFEKFLEEAIEMCVFNEFLKSFVKTEGFFWNYFLEKRKIVNLLEKLYKANDLQAQLEKERENGNKSFAILVYKNNSIFVQRNEDLLLRENCFFRKRNNYFCKVFVFNNNFEQLNFYMEE